MVHNLEPGSSTRPAESIDAPNLISGKNLIFKDWQFNSREFIGSNFSYSASRHRYTIEIPAQLHAGIIQAGRRFCPALFFCGHLVEPVTKGAMIRFMWFVRLVVVKVFGT